MYGIEVLIKYYDFVSTNYKMNILWILTPILYQELLKQMSEAFLCFPWQQALYA